MKPYKIILLTAVFAVTAEAVVPHGYEHVSLAQQIVPRQPAQPVEPGQSDDQHEPVGGEGPTFLVGYSASAATNTTATIIRSRSNWL
jgi:hypothetical protein